MKLTSFAPQFLVDDLERSMAYYRKVGFTFGEPWGGFYGIGRFDGLELHLKEAPRNNALLWFVLVVAAIGCGRSPVAGDLSDGDIASIRATSDRWITAIRAGRMEDVAATFTEDAVLQIAGTKYEGRPAILRFFEAAPAWDPTRELHIDEIKGRGDLAFVSGHSTVTPPGGAPVVVGRYTDIRRRQPDGTWLFYRDFVSPVPLAPPNVSDADVASIRKEVTGQFEAENEAVDKLDCTGINQRSDDREPVFVSQGRVARTREVLRKFCDQMLVGRTGAAWKDAKTTVHVLSPSVAYLVREGTYTITYSDRAPRALAMVMTNIFQRADRQWVGVHIHESFVERQP